MKIFKHFIFTRYNLGLYDNDKIEDKEVWMNKRLELFENCADSIRNQTEQDFTWIIGLDAKTPKRAEKKIQKLATFNTIVTPQEIKEFFISKVVKGVKTEWIITSRLDNDDFLDPEYVETIQDNFRGKTEVLDVQGVQWEVKTNKFYTSGRKRPNSPFLSLVETREDVKTCYHTNHTNMPDVFPARMIDKVLYTQVIHDGCLMNKVLGEPI